MSDDREMIEHKVKVDEYISLNVNIPKQTSIKEIEDILSRIKSFSSSSGEPLRKTPNKKAGRKPILFDDETKQTIVDLKNNNYTNKEVMRHLRKKGKNYTAQQIKDKVAQLKNKGEILPYNIAGQKRSKEPKKKTKAFTDEMVQDIQKLKERDWANKQITEFINDKYETTLTNKQVNDKIVHLKIAGKINPTSNDMMGITGKKPKTPDEDNNVRKFSFDQVEDIAFLKSENYDNENIKDTVNAKYNTDFTQDEIDKKIDFLTKRKLI